METEDFMERKTAVTVSLSGNDIKILDEIGNLQRRSRADIIREAVKIYLKKNK